MKLSQDCKQAAYLFSLKIRQIIQKFQQEYDKIPVCEKAIHSHTLKSVIDDTVTEFLKVVNANNQLVPDVFQNKNLFDIFTSIIRINKDENIIPYLFVQLSEKLGEELSKDAEYLCFVRENWPAVNREIYALSKKYYDEYLTDSLKKENEMNNCIEASDEDLAALINKLMDSYAQTSFPRQVKSVEGPFPAKKNSNNANLRFPYFVITYDDNTELFCPRSVWQVVLDQLQKDKEKEKHSGPQPRLGRPFGFTDTVINPQYPPFASAIFTPSLVTEPLAESDPYWQQIIHHVLPLIAHDNDQDKAAQLGRIEEVMSAYLSYRKEKTILETFLRSYLTQQ